MIRIIPHLPEMMALLSLCRKPASAQHRLHRAIKCFVECTMSQPLTPAGISFPLTTFSGPAMNATRRMHATLYTVTNNIQRSQEWYVLTCTSPYRGHTSPGLNTVRGRCCNCGSTGHNFRWCPAVFKDVVSRLNPDFASNKPDRSVFDASKQRSHRRHHRSNLGHQDNGKHNASRMGRFSTFNRERRFAPQGNSARTTYDAIAIAVPT